MKLRFLVGLAHKITEAIGTTNMPQVREQLGALAASAGMVDAMLSGMEASGGMRGAFYLPNRHQLYAAHVTTQELYPRLVNLIRDLAGGALIMLPSSVRDWANPELAPIIAPDPAVAELRCRGKGQAAEGGLGRDRLGVRLAAHAV